MTKSEFREFMYWTDSASDAELDNKTVELFHLKTTLTESDAIRDTELYLKHIKFEVRARREVADLAEARKAA